MRNKFTYLMLLAGLLVCGCQEPVLEIAEEYDPAGEPVQFCVGTKALTRAGDIYYMPDGSRFTCRMYYVASNEVNTLDIDGGTMQRAWLKVNGNTGNSLYWNNQYAAATVFDKYGNEYSTDANRFFWQNRKEHAFVAFTNLNRAKDADYKYYENNADAPKGIVDNNLRDDKYNRSFVYVNDNHEVVSPVHHQTFYDLRRVDWMTSINDQPDICKALTIKAPEGATPEANRVNLYFEHQFSQIRVNIKNAADNSVSIVPADIDSVELLGISDTALVYHDFMMINNEYVSPATSYKEVNLEYYTNNQLKKNEFGSSFKMFDMAEAEVPSGYLRSFNAITFGLLRAIRITWHESDTGVAHVVTYKVTDTKQQTLKSGTRYVWNMELRRGAVAVIKAEIVPWVADLEYEVPGYIVK